MRWLLAMMLSGCTLIGGAMGASIANDSNRQVERRREAAETCTGDAPCPKPPSGEHSSVVAHVALGAVIGLAIDVLALYLVADQLGETTH